MVLKALPLTGSVAASVYQQPIHNKQTGLICGYCPVQYRVEACGGLINRWQQDELERFVNEFLTFTRCETINVYFRLDCYLVESELVVLEINSVSADGWGPAFHLARLATGRPRIRKDLYLPEFWTTYDPRFQPAIDLVCEELRTAGRMATPLSWDAALGTADKVFAYLQQAPAHRPDHFIPGKIGELLEDKIHLARFSRHWHGDRVFIPTTYWCETSLLQTLKHRMGRLVFKPTRKVGDRNVDSVWFGRSSQQPREVVDALAYLRGEIIVQERVLPEEINGCPVQVILLFGPHRTQDRLLLAGGYLQIGSPGSITVNDMAAHGPIVLDP